jgi:ribonuclease Y
MEMTTILLSLLAAVVGIGVGFFIRNLAAKKELKEREAKADEIIEKAKKAADDIKYKARKETKDVVKEERTEFENYLRNRQQEMKDQERDLVKRETTVEQKTSEIDKGWTSIRTKEEDVERHRQKVLQEMERYKQRQR